MEIGKACKQTNTQTLSFIFIMNVVYICTYTYVCMYVDYIVYFEFRDKKKV